MQNNKKKKIKSSSVGDKIYTKKGTWSFDFSSTDKFDGHIRKSIPLYKEMHNLSLSYLSFFVRKKSVIYDLGCSTGSFTKLIAKKYEHLSPNIIGIDESKNMINFAKINNKHKKIHYKKIEIEKLKFKKCDIIIMNFTLQFIKPQFRQKLINKIYKYLNWGGAIIIFEKIRGQDARFQDYMSLLYSDYKLKMNYTHKEIHSKASSLKGVLEPYTSKENKLFLKRANFKDYSTIFKYLCFEGILAIK